jgi:hypothetical protein
MPGLPHGPGRWRSGRCAERSVRWSGGQATGIRLAGATCPQAVSDPWLVQEEFGRHRTPTASAADRAQGQAARETPAKTRGTLPLEFKDTATGGHFDVV